MERWIGRVALVTGASTGIGSAVVERLVKHGMKVVGCARNVDRIEANGNALLHSQANANGMGRWVLGVMTPESVITERFTPSDHADKLTGKKGRLFPVKCDVRNEDEVLAMFDEIRSKHGGVDVCVNNAGVAHVAPLVSGETKDWANMLNVNVLGLAVCTREAVKSMKERGVDDGHVIQVNSMSGKQVGPPDLAFYSATKFAVSAMAEGLRNELVAMNSHIKVSQISPGVVETEFSYRARGPEEGKKRYSMFKPLEAKDMADSVEYVLSVPLHVQVHDVIVLPTEQPQ